jgi:hypothetical protein
LGVTPGVAVWEVAARRVENGRSVGSMSVFVQHDPQARDDDYPEPMADDYAARYDRLTASPAEVVLSRVSKYAEGRAIVCGSNPYFDMTHLEKLAADNGIEAPPWHYHPLDIPTLVHGYLLGKGIAPAQPWTSEFMSRCVGVDPRDYGRHTAAGDVEWTYAMWLAIGGDS